MKKIVSLLCLFIVLFLITGCEKGYDVDFELVAGSMVSKDNMSEDEKRMHDAKVIQYAVYQTKKVIAKGYNDENSRLIGDIALSVKANLFSTANPRDWLYTYYHFFSFYEDIESVIKLRDNHPSGFSDPVQSRWRCLTSNIDELEEAADKYVGASIAERANLDTELKTNLVPILETLNNQNLVTIYRNKNAEHQYMFGTQPEPTRESILFAQDALQKMLKIAPIGEMSTITLAHIYINDMIDTLNSMLDDYDATRYDPTYKTMHQWGVTHARLGGSWAGYNDLVNKLKNLFKEDENITEQVETLTMNLPLPSQDEKYVLSVYVNGELDEGLSGEVLPSDTNKEFTFTGNEHDEYIIKFKVNDEIYKFYDVQFETKTVEEIN